MLLDFSVTVCLVKCFGTAALFIQYVIHSALLLKRGANKFCNATIISIQSFSSNFPLHPVSTPVAAPDLPHSSRRGAFTVGPELGQGSTLMPVGNPRSQPLQQPSPATTAYHWQMTSSTGNKEWAAYSHHNRKSMTAGQSCLLKINDKHLDEGEGTLPDWAKVKAKEGWYKIGPGSRRGSKGENERMAPKSSWRRQRRCWAWC